MLLAYWATLSKKAKIYSGVVGAVTATCAAIVAIPPAWSSMGLPEVATRQWVTVTVHSPMKVAQANAQKQVIELQIDVAKGKLDQLDLSKSQLEIERQKTSDDTIKAIANSQLLRIDRDAAAIQDQIRTLQNMLRQ